MASSRNSSALAWSAAAYVDIASGGNATSDAVAFNAEDWDGSLTVHVDNQGTPANGDTLDVYILWTSGDVKGDSDDDYDTAKNATSVMRLNTYATDADGEDPAQKTIPLPAMGAKGFKLYTKNNSGGRTLRVRAMISTHRPQ